MPGAYLWGWDTPNWRRVIVDGTGHLQVDVLSTVMDAGAATAANQVITHGYIDGLEGLLGGGLPAALDAGDLAVREQGTPAQHCYGWDNVGGVWDRLRLDPSLNLQVSLFDGANGIDSALGSTAALTDALRGLVSNSLLRLSEDASATWNEWRVAGRVFDATDGFNMASVALYGWNGATFDRLRMESDALHNLKVKLYDGADGIDSSLLNANPAAANRGLNTIAAMVGWHQVAAVPRLLFCDDPLDALEPLNSLLVISQLYGYNGSEWDRLRMESGARHNLRVCIYAHNLPIYGVNCAAATSTLTAAYRLAVANTPYLRGTATTSYAQAPAFWVGDGDGGSQFPITAIMGYNGATWDRLRAYATGILKVGRAEVGLLDVRMTGTGQVGAVGARKLYWMLLNPSAGLSLFELTDATAGGAAVKADHFDTTRDGHILNFDPPLEFSNGIWLETITNITSILFGYL